MSDLYVMQSSYGHIKIGRATHPASRLSAVEHYCGLPVRLLFVGPGAGETEPDLHEELRRHRLKGEWFANNPASRAIINAFVGQALAFIEAPLPRYGRAPKAYQVVRRVLANGKPRIYRYYPRRQPVVKDGEMENT